MGLTGGAGGPTPSSQWIICAHPQAVAPAPAPASAPAPCLCPCTLSTLQQTERYPQQTQSVGLWSSGLNAGWTNK